MNAEQAQLAIPGIKTTENLSDLFRVLQHLSFGDQVVVLIMIVGAMSIFALVCSIFPIPRMLFLKLLDHIESLARGSKVEDFGSKDKKDE